MDSIWVEGFKLIGSAAGILSGAFLVYDRFVRSRPQVYLAKHGSYEIDVVLKNAANETLIVNEIGVAPNVLGLARGHQTRDILPVIVRRGVEDAPEEVSARSATLDFWCLDCVRAPAGENPDSRAKA